MINVEDLDRAVVQVNAVDHTICPPPCAQTAYKRTDQGLAHSEWVLSQRAVKKVQHGSRYCLRQPFGQRAPRRRLAPNLEPVG